MVLVGDSIAGALAPVVVERDTDTRRLVTPAAAKLPKVVRSGDGETNSSRVGRPLAAIGVIAPNCARIIASDFMEGRRQGRAGISIEDSAPFIRKLYFSTVRTSVTRTFQDR